MSRVSLLVVAGTLVLFVAVGGFLVFRNQGGGGRPVSLDVSVTGAARMSPGHLTARQGDLVTLNVTSDQAGDVHLHGYDIHFEARPGETASQTFRADKTGDFDIEWETTGTHLGDLAVSP